MRTDFLFAAPGAWSGFARLFDIAGTFDRYNVSQTNEEADARALFSDWRMVGEDLLTAACELRRSKPKPFAGRTVYMLTGGLYWPTLGG